MRNPRNKTFNCFAVHTLSWYGRIGARKALEPNPTPYRSKSKHAPCTERRKFPTTGQLV